GDDPQRRPEEDVEGPMGGVGPATEATGATDALPAPAERGALAEISRLLPYAREHAALFVVTLLVTVSLAVVDIPIPFALKKIIDSVLHQKQPVTLLGLDLPARSFLLAIFLCLVGIAVVKGLLLYLQRMSSETMGQRMIFALRMDLYRHLQSLSMPFF